MAVKVGINGFGRIGRNVLRAALGNKEIDFVAVNDLTSPAILAHLLKYDSILGNLKNEIGHGDDFITVDGKKIKVWAERDPAKLPWAEVGAQIVVESTGHFTDGTKAKAHLGATVKKVIISAPELTTFHPHPVRRSVTIMGLVELAFGQFSGAERTRLTTHVSPIIKEKNRWQLRLESMASAALAATFCAPHLEILRSILSPSTI